MLEKLLEETQEAQTLVFVKSWVTSRVPGNQRRPSVMSATERGKSLI